MPKPFKILAIDGGGIRGVYPAAYLNYAQGQIGSVPIHKFFDLIVGTSTGGIIALALSLGISTSKILEMYEKKGKEIFGWSPKKLTLGLIFPKYSNKRLIRELKSILGNETKLAEAKTMLCIPSVDTINGKAVVFKTRHHQEYINDYKIPMWKIAAATSAAPAYLPSFSDPKLSSYVDGGLWANNPSLIGVAEALKLDRKLSDIFVLSIGTGDKILYKSRFTSRTWGLIGWGAQLVEWIFKAQSQGAINATRYLLGNNYQRIDSQLPVKNGFLSSSRFGLDSVRDIMDIKALAEYRAKETFYDVSKTFFNEEVAEFHPIP